MIKQVILSLVTFGLVVATAFAECETEIEEWADKGTVHLTSCIVSDFETTLEYRDLKLLYIVNSNKWLGAIILTADNVDWWKCPEATRNPHEVAVIATVDSERVDGLFKSSVITAIATNLDVRWGEHCNRDRQSA